MMSSETRRGRRRTGQSRGGGRGKRGGGRGRFWMAEEDVHLCCREDRHTEKLSWLEGWLDESRRISADLVGGLLVVVVGGVWGEWTKEEGEKSGEGKKRGNQNGKKE